MLPGVILCNFQGHARQRSNVYNSCVTYLLTLLYSNTIYIVLFENS